MPASEEAPGGLAPDLQTGLAAAPGDPAAWLYLLSPPGGEGLVGGGQAALAQAPASPRALEPELLALAERWVRRLSWAGDGRRGTARLELGAGALAGAELIVVAEGGRVSVDLNVPTAADEAVAARVAARLQTLGYSAEVKVG